MFRQILRNLNHDTIKRNNEIYNFCIASNFPYSISQKIQKIDPKIDVQVFGHESFKQNISKTMTIFENIKNNGWVENALNETIVENEVKYIINDLFIKSKDNVEFNLKFSDYKYRCVFEGNKKYTLYYHESFNNSVPFLHETYNNEKDVNSIAKKIVVWTKIYSSLLKNKS